jgi:hypothetical protein
LRSESAEVRAFFPDEALMKEESRFNVDRTVAAVKKMGRKMKDEPIAPGGAKPAAEDTFGLPDEKPSMTGRRKTRMRRAEACPQTMPRR